MNNEGITLITCHASKGLEWDRVYVVGAHEGMMPHRLSSDLEEESNLFYVACTRARTDLHLTYVKEPSRFIPAEFITPKK